MVTQLKVKYLKSWILVLSVVNWNKKFKTVLTTEVYGVAVTYKN